METHKKNLFEDFQRKKTKVCQLAQSALNAGWLNENAYQAILKKINEDILTIGVIGQMKCGKSTFLNSFLFSRQLLPAATTPMTAALSVITYGEKEQVEAEFYTANEWEELRSLAQRDEDEISDSQIKSSVKAAKELSAKSRIIQDVLPQLLGTKKVDSLDHLIDYVGADGKYVSIVKSVRITLPEEWLKGVEIVDTPGFNDPVVSREERTKEFLKRADVVLMMLYAGRAFDATDRDILFEKVRKVGIGKIILAVNKYDLQLAQGESPETISGFVKEELRKAIRQESDESVAELLEDVEPILVSAQMALLGKMPLSEIEKDDDLKYHYNKTCDIFELTTQAQLLKMSHIHELEAKVKDLITNQKEKILIRKPINQILQVAKNQLDEKDTLLLQLNEKAKYLSIPDEELEDKIASLEKAQRRIERKIKNAENDLSETYDEISTRLFRQIQDMADNAQDECERLIQQYKKDTLKRKVNNRLERFKNREMSRALEDVSKKIKRELNDNILQLTEDIENVIDRYLDGSEEIAEEFRRILNRGLDEDYSDNEMKNKEEDTEEESSFGDILLGIGGAILAVPVLPLILGGAWLDSQRDEVREYCDHFFSSIKWDEFKNKLATAREKFINTLNGDASLSLINNLSQQAQDALNSKEEKEKQLTEVNQQITALRGQKAKMESELIEFKAMVTED